MSADADFDRFFLGEHRKIVALALAWTGDREVAQDVAQEVLARAFRQWAKVSSLDAPGGWTHRVAINLLIDRRRDLDRRSLASARLGQPSPYELPEPADSWQAAVRQLPDRERAAVVLHYVADLSVAQIAEMLSVSEGTVKATLSHARTKLRSTLTEGSVHD